MHPFPGSPKHVYYPNKGSNKQKENAGSKQMTSESVRAQRSLERRESRSQDASGVANQERSRRVELGPGVECTGTLHTIFGIFL